MFQYFFQNHLLTTTIVLKLLSTNYFVHFGHLLDYANICNPILKPFMRLTDSGCIATIIYVCYPHFFPVAFNLHFLICVAYFISVVLFSMTDVDEISQPYIDDKYSEIWCYFVHFMPLLFLLFYLFKDNHKFTFQTYLYSVAWVLIWFIFIYIPWRLLTGDAIYNILEEDQNKYMQLTVVFSVFVLLYIGNSLGCLISRNKP